MVRTSARNYAKRYGTAISARTAGAELGPLAHPKFREECSLQSDRTPLGDAQLHAIRRENVVQALCRAIAPLKSIQKLKETMSLSALPSPVIARKFPVCTE
jgi:hypothetical protein